jgi:U3 small nucleolar RNA-associated protein 24
MGKAKKTRKFAQVKRMLNPKDLKPPEKKQKKEEEEVRHV